MVPSLLVQAACIELAVLPMALDRLVGIFKGRRIHMSDVLAASRTRASARRRRALAVVAACVAAAGKGEPRRKVHRALGGWRGSTIAGYLYRGDDITLKKKIRMTRGTLDKLVELLEGSCFDGGATDRLSTQIHCELRHQERKRRQVAARRMVAARSKTDPPSLLFKTAAVMYAFANGGPLGILADALSIAESTLRRWIQSFCVAVFKVLKPIYLPAKPFSEEERQAVQGQFASRRGINGVTL